jgi:uncharacterized membrane protein YfcA
LSRENVLEQIVKLALLVLAGIIAGFVNVNAGGGSLLTVPALIFLGIPPTVANGTNRIALFFQNISSIITFWRKGHFYPKLVIQLAVPAILGSIAGARLAVKLPETVFRSLLSAVLILVILLMAFNPHTKLKQTDKKMTPMRNVLLACAFVLVGFYGGFIQVGVGFIIITTMMLLTPFSLVTINCVKVSVVLFYTISSLIVFMLSGKVEYGAGLFLAVGNSLGAWLGTVFAVKKGDKWIRIIFLIAAAAMALKVSGVFDIILAR